MYLTVGAVLKRLFDYVPRQTRTHGRTATSLTSVTSGLASNAGMASSSALPTTNWLRELTVCIDGASPALDVAARVLTQLGARVVTETAGVASADVVLVDRIQVASAIPGAAHASAKEYLAYVSRTNQAVWVTATAFGLSTARADDVASDLTLLAS